MAVEVGRNAKDFDCQTCSVKHCDQNGELPGSNGAANFDVWEIDGVGYRTCPLMQITAMSRQFISLHNHYSKQLLWQAGGLMDQPKPYLQAMEIIESKPYD